MGDRTSGPAVVFFAILIASMLTVITLWPGQPASYELTKDNDPMDTLDHDPEDEVPYEVPHPVAFTEDPGSKEVDTILCDRTEPGGTGPARKRGDDDP